MMIVPYKQDHSLHYKTNCVTDKNIIADKHFLYIVNLTSILFETYL